MRKSYDTWYYRIFLFVPILTLTCILWIIIGLFSVKSLGKVLEETGKNMQK